MIGSEVELRCLLFYVLKSLCSINYWMVEISLVVCCYWDSIDLWDTLPNE